MLSDQKKLANEKTIGAVPAFPYKSDYIRPTVAEFIGRLQPGKFDELKLVKSTDAKDKTTQLPFPTKLSFQVEKYFTIDVLTDLLTEYARVQANIHGQECPLNYWNKNHSQIRVLAKRRYGKVTSETLRETLYAQCKEATGFSITIAKTVYDLLLQGKKNAQVLDPFSGWGDRALAVLGCPQIKDYFGIDSNSRLKEGYAKIADLDKDRIHLSLKRFEDWQPDIKTKTDFDLIFTSPPYYDYEVYEQHSTHQSISDKRDYAEWLELFMIPALAKMTSLLKEDGLLALHIGQTFRTPKMGEDVFLAITKRLDCVHVQNIDCSTGNKRSIPIWIYRRKKITPPV